MKPNCEGKNLQVGDEIVVWWTSRKDTIIALEHCPHPLNCFKEGNQFAYFEINKHGMTIPNNELFEVLNRECSLGISK